MKRRNYPGQVAALGLALASMAAIPTAHAAEGGMGVYLLGIAGPQAGYLPDPGSYGRYDRYHYEAWTRNHQSLSANRERRLDHPGPGGGRVNLSASADAELTARSHLDLDADIVTGMHIFETEWLGGHPALALIIPYVDADMDLSAQADAAADITLSTPRGRQASILRNGSRSGDIAFGTDNMGDAILGGLVGWHDGRLHYTAGVNVYAPTGEYHEDAVLNAGRNYWAIEPNAAFTYLNTDNGREFSALAGWTFNDENPATHYDTGDELHLEWAAIQHLSQYFYIGMAGYAYQQTSGDSGRGATLGAFKGQALAAGPVLGATLPLGHEHNLVLNARYYNEFDTENRMAGDAVFVTAIMNF